MGEVLFYKGVQVVAFYVVGAVFFINNCVVKNGDNDYLNIEKYVIYNWGKFGDGLI